MRQSGADRFFGKVRMTDGCWLWTGAQDGKGYGLLRHGGRGWRAHRLAYTMLVGPIPEGLTLDHLCRVHNCVRPEHLEAVTVRENNLRGYGWSGRKARQTHCKRGHLLAGDNLHLRKDGGRECRSCARTSSQKWSNENRVKRRKIGREWARRNRERLRSLGTTS